MTPEPRLAARLLDGEQVPPGRLAALVEIELESAGQRALDLLARERGLRARNAGDELAAFGERLDRLGEHGLGIAPRDQLIARVADRVACAEAALDVVARRRRDAPRRKRRHRRPQRLGVL